ncbi:MAG: 50S ribosomal protein L4 [Candidatus Omnitrophota bacterium]|jgi:large subunit ribosomal protein L4|nr:50S ribosomal protein L4 [Candidatus Omnitrophota bacterium]MDD3982995.1 50S ribosomal protein L4 [Candidatus Omnitrophota bacterium]MDD5526052.1 50S ribosomal protein L4 [Candidatus Omnitrophota bacterium]
MITLPVLDAKGKEVDSIKLDKEVISDKINTSLIYQAIVNLRAGQRKGLASTKTRGEVSGGGRKPWKQKGTGRARVGSSRNPLWYHGGVVFGPHPRDFSYSLPAKIKRGALKEAFSVKVSENAVKVLDDIKAPAGKTREVVSILSALGMKQSRKTPDNRCLLLLDKVDGNMARAAGNIAGLRVSRAGDTNAYELLSHKTIVCTRGALTLLLERFNK